MLICRIVYGKKVSDDWTYPLDPFGASSAVPKSLYQADDAFIELGMSEPLECWEGGSWLHVRYASADITDRYELCNGGANEEMSATLRVARCDLESIYSCQQIRGISQPHPRALDVVSLRG